MSRITIYTALLCPYCHMAKRLLGTKSVPFDEVDVTFQPEARAEMRDAAGGENSVPQIWIGDKHVGGCDELYELERQGQLDGLLMPAS